MELQVGESKSIPEGRHEATIISVERRNPETDKDTKFDYMDYSLRLENVDGKPTIKYGVPTNIKVDQTGQPTTSHAKMLKQLGMDLKGSVNPENLKGTKISCLVQNEETTRGTFARVVEGSIKRI